METLKNIVMLIDADNTRLSKLEGVIREISTHGRIVAKRAYANWKKESLKNWESELKRLAVRAMQQFDYVARKNATDMALVIDAVNLLHTGIYDAFVIVSSDSDYTPLAINLHESGVYVMGVGEKTTPESFRNSCDEFVFLENIQEDREEEPAAPGTPPAAPEREKEQSTGEDDIEAVHSLLKVAYDKNQDDDGYANVSVAGQFIKRVKPDFDVRSYGYVKLTNLLKDFPERYELRQVKGKGTSTMFLYKCVTPERKSSRRGGGSRKTGAGGAKRGDGQ